MSHAEHPHHEHGGHHHHHVHVHQIKSLNAVFILSIVINLLFVGVETVVGIVENSVSLLSDAGHNLSDVFSLLLVLVAFQLSKLHANDRFTYGYKKSTVLISLVNAVILLVAVGVIIVESIHKFSHPVDINGEAVSWTAGIGILVNGVTMLLLMRDQKKDLNVRGAFLHMMADTLVSVGVMVSGFIIMLTGYNWIDPVISLVIAAVILFSTWNLLAESLRLTLDAAPHSIDMGSMKALMTETPHVTDVHHVHIWAISTTENALTAHLVIDDLQRMGEVKQTVKQVLKDHGIAHATLEIETPDQRCAEDGCTCC